MAVNNPAPQKKSTLDTVANIAIIIVCAIAAAVLVRNQFFPPQPSGPPQAKKGEQYAQLKAVVPPGASRALVVAVQPGCHFCNDSMTFYKQLLDQRNSQASKVKFVAAVPANDKPADAKKLVDDEAEKFSSVGAKPDSMVNLDFAAVKVPGTPTLMLVDNNGKILNVWVGKLDPGSEKEVLKTL
jgi:thioredoxin-related protein